MNDITELAALNRQITQLRAELGNITATLAETLTSAAHWHTERDQYRDVLRALLPHVMWFHVSNARECIYCHCEIVYEVDHLTCHHEPDCPYRRAVELIAGEPDAPLTTP